MGKYFLRINKTLLFMRAENVSECLQEPKWGPYPEAHKLCLICPPITYFYIFQAVSLFRFSLPNYRMPFFLVGRIFNMSCSSEPP